MTDVKNEAPAQCIPGQARARACASSASSAALDEDSLRPQHTNSERVLRAAPGSAPVNA